jgi:hypothetical protein
MLSSHAETKSYSIGSGKESHVKANFPCRGFVFHDKGDSNGL